MDYTGKIISKNPPQPTQASASGVWTLDEAAAAVKNNSWPIPGVPNPISKSLRFNSADSAYLSRTPASAGNRKTWTLSLWFKRSALPSSGYQSLIGADSGGGQSFYVAFDNSSQQLEMGQGASVYRKTTQVFRDPSAWYHIVVALDTTQATADDRIKIYANGTQITSFGTTTNPSQNADLAWNSNVGLGVGADITTSGARNFFSGYLTEINFIDGQALTPSSFGQTNANTGVWEPKPYTGSYGTNGFYLNFKDSATTTALGYDYSGNGNNWTPNNFSVTAGAGNDSLVDVPTQWIGYNTSGDTGGIWRGNYATWNPLDTLAAAVANYTNGNLDTAYTTANYTGRATMAVTSGKWYWEITITTAGNPVGIATAAAATNQYPGQNASSWGYYTNGNKYTNGSASAYGNSYTTGDVIGVAFDADGGNLYFYKNGTVQNSGTAAFTSLTSGPYFPAMGNGVCVTNFGQRPFAYTPPAGYLSLCTTNLPTPTIGATSTTQANDYFDVTLYTGTDATQSITNSGSMQPDFVWVKARNGAYNHYLYDVIRGSTNALRSSTTGAESQAGNSTLVLQSTGFQVTGTGLGLNSNGTTIVGWQWKGGGTGVSNTAGTITSTVSANADAGFSIVTYTGTGANATVGHGCKVNNVATAPSMIITKKRSSTSDWGVYHTSLGNTNYLLLDTTAASAASSTYWNNTSPTSTLFSIGTADPVNINTATYVAYCFAPVAGYSAFGSYTGNGSTDGPFVYTGFRPRYVLIKRTDSTNDWVVHDTARDSYNVADKTLYPNLADAEFVVARLDILSNGFKLRSTSVTTNANGGTYVYACFAENPFKYALAR